MTSFAFRDTKTGKNMKLAEVDEIVCRWLDIPTNPDRYHQVFNDIVEVGIALEMAGNDDILDGFEKKINSAQLLFYRYMLRGRFKFEAWR